MCRKRRLGRTGTKHLKKKQAVVKENTEERLAVAYDEAAAAEGGSSFAGRRECRPSHVMHLPRAACACMHTREACICVQTCDLCAHAQEYLTRSRRRHLWRS